MTRFKKNFKGKLEIGEKVYIKGKPSDIHIYGGEWGIVRLFDGYLYHVGMWGSKLETARFYRDEMYSITI